MQQTVTRETASKRHSLTGHVRAPGMTIHPIETAPLWDVIEVFDTAWKSGFMRTDHEGTFWFEDMRGNTIDPIYWRTTEVQS